MQAADTFRAEILSIQRHLWWTTDEAQCEVAQGTVPVGHGGSQKPLLVGNQLFGLLSCKEGGWEASGLCAMQSIPALPNLGSQEQLRTAAFTEVSCPQHSSAWWDLSNKGECHTLHSCSVPGCPFFRSLSSKQSFLATTLGFQECCSRWICLVQGWKSSDWLLPLSASTITWLFCIYAQNDFGAFVSALWQKLLALLSLNRFTMVTFLRTSHPASHKFCPFLLCQRNLTLSCDHFEWLITDFFQEQRSVKAQFMMEKTKLSYL